MFDPSGERRNVIRMAALYIAGSWLIMQVANLMVDELAALTPTKRA